jgi:hypothetical protein
LARKISNLEQIGFWITERTRNLSGRNLHLDSGLEHNLSAIFSFDKATRGRAGTPKTS